MINMKVLVAWDKEHKKEVPMETMVGVRILAH